MKLLLLAAALLLAPALSGETLAVLAPGETRGIGAGAAPADPVPARAKLLAALQDAVAHPRPWAESLDLVDALDWGRQVPGAAARLQFDRRFAGGFHVRVQLSGLIPHHRYVLCVNGNPTHAGNAALPTPVPGNPQEKYYDFFSPETDADGRFDGTFGLLLAPGPYDVHFYVKDATDHKIILWHEYFGFTVE